MQKPSIPKGMRDFSPHEMAKRSYIFDTIENVYRLYGYRPIETPAIENLSTLMGKYGEEGDRLLFKILNSGNFLAGIDPRDLSEENPAKIAAKIAEKGLRYDLTVPFARYVVMHRNEITFPFKRFQIQPVWRADRPQKGRYREFFQCDADVIGSTSLLNETELLQIIDDVFSRFDIRVDIRINNRKILSGIAQTIGQAGKIADITVAIDKLDKIGLEKVNEELASKDIPQAAINKLQPIILLRGSNREKIDTLKTVLSSSQIALKGIEEIEFIIAKTDRLQLKNKLQLDLTLARGLNYYTGAIIEVKATDAEIGSIAGGGRYDNLTGIFGLPDVSGVGISFGADRIFDVMDQLNLFPQKSTHATDLLFVNFGEKETDYLLPVVSEIRREGIRCELYPEAAKMKKQLSYADSNHIPFVAIAGENEMKEGKIILKNMQSGEQRSMNTGELLATLKANG